MPGRISRREVSALIVVVVLVAILGAGCAPSLPGSNSRAAGTASPAGPTPTATARPCSQQDATFKEFPEILGGIWSMTLGPDGNLWLTTTNAIMRVTPAGQTQAFAVAGFPYGITVGPDQHLWFIDRINQPNDRQHIGRISLDGAIQEFRTPAGEVIAAGSLAAGADGNMWYFGTGLKFIDTHGGHFDSFIARMTPTGTVTPFPIPSGNVEPFSYDVPVSYPRNLIGGAGGSVWFTATQLDIKPRDAQGVIAEDNVAGRVGSVTSAGAIREVTLPARVTDAGDITTGPNGTMWFSAHSSGVTTLNSVTPSGTVTAFSLTYRGVGAIAAGSDGSMWATEYVSDDSLAIARIGVGGEVKEYLAPSHIAREQYRYQAQLANSIVAGTSRDLWFTERLVNEIGRVRLDGSIAEFALPPSTHAISALGDIAVDANDAVWYTRTYFNDDHSAAVSGSLGSLSLPASCA